MPEWIVTHLLQSGLIADVMLIVLAVEALSLTIYYKVSRRGIAPRYLPALLGAGACLALALRAALTGAAPHWIVLAITASLIFHLIDLTQRWRR